MTALSIKLLLAQKSAKLYLKLDSFESDNNFKVILSFCDYIGCTSFFSFKYKCINI